MTRPQESKRQVSTLFLVVVLLIFGTSGACGLAYQIVWSRMFAFGLGHEWPSVLAIIAAFFGGLAVGSWSLDKSVSCSRNPGRWYAILEISIGVWALSSIYIIPTVTQSGVLWIGLEPSPLRQWTISFLVPFLILIPATTCLGATFPAMERFFSNLSGNAKCVGSLYSVNTLGAVLGVLSATFYIIPAFGFSTTLCALAILNVLCGLMIVVLETKAKNHRSREQPPPGYAGSPSRLRWTVFLTGLLGIGYEVLGVRVLAEVFENTIFSFASALAVYLSGTAIGAALFQYYQSRLSNRGAFEILLYALSVSCLAGAWMLSKAQAIYGTATGFFGDGMQSMVFAELSVSAVVFAIPTMLMGAVFSHVVQSARRADGGIGQAIAWNMFGSAVAPILFGVFLLPITGAKWALALVATGYLALFPRLTRFVFLGFPLPVGLLLLIPSNLHSVKTPPGGEILEIREGVMSSVAVVRHFDNHRSLLVNNRFAMGGTGAASAAQRHAHIPLLLHDHPNRALFLGVGTGITFAAAKAYTDLEADGVELVPEVVDVRHFFEPFNELRQGMKLYVADARRFVRGSNKSYDVIVADLFHPARDGAGALYTVEHFEAIRRILSPSGLFCQWLPLFQLDETMLRVITRTVTEVFPHTRAFLLRWNVDTPVLGLIATLKSKKYPANWYETRVSEPELAANLRAVTLSDGFHLFGTFLAGPRQLRQFSSWAALNSDNHPVVMFQAPYFTYRRNEASYGRLLRLLDQFSTDSEELIEEGSQSAEFTTRLNQYISARNVYLRGLVAETESRKVEAIDAYIESAKLSSHFSAGYAHCLAIAVRQSRTDPSGARTLLEQLVQAAPERPVAGELIKRLFEP